MAIIFAAVRQLQLGQFGFHRRAVDQAHMTALCHFLGGAFMACFGNDRHAHHSDFARLFDQRRDSVDRYVIVLYHKRVGARGVSR